MPFTVEDFPDLIRLLEQHPEWRAELRRQVLSDELLALPTLVRQIAEAQAATETRLDRIEAAIERLVEAQARTEQRVEELAARMDQLATRMDQLTDAQIRLEQAMASLAVDVAALKGHDLERRYRERPFDFFGRLIRRAHTYTQEELDQWLEAPVAAGALSESEADEILLADVVVRGRRKSDGAEVYLVVEVAATLDSHDVERAARRAELLGRAGVVALPVMAGPAASQDAQQAARAAGMTWLANGAARLMASGS